MKKLFFYRSQSSKGFTLVELLVVLAIIGVLSTLIVANFSSSRARARDSRRKSDLQQLKTSLRLYYNDYQKYPDSSGGQLRGCGSGSGTLCPWGSGFTTSDQEYMKQLPLDPINNTTTGYIYNYTQTDSGQGFTVTAKLENVSDTDSSNSQARCGQSPAQTQVYMICED